MPDLALTPLDDLAVLDVRGPDALTFLQGQLSQDLNLLPERGALLAGLHNPQGRLIALLRLLHLAADRVLVVLPADIAREVRLHLSRYVLRAKVTIEEAGSTWRVYGVSGPQSVAAASTRLHMSAGGPDERELIVAPRSEPVPEGEPATREDWRLQDIQAGIAEIGTGLSGAFVAQMVNLDRIGAIAFDKGCYTGQEVIARAHYRGQVKRRMQRFATAAEAPLAPGQKLRLADGRSAQVVMSAPAEGGGQEFLAVAPLQAGTTDALSTDEAVVEATPLPLPYSLPD